MSDAARKAARGLNRDFGELAELQVAKKAPADFVSAADLKAEQVLFEALTKARPGYGFHGEERGLIEGSDKTHTWIVDPLDGTTNFLHAIPHFAINIALEREGVVVAAVTYNPITNEMFWAEKGKGCFVNDHRLRVAARQRLDESVLATGIPFLGHGQHAKFLKELHQISQRFLNVRLNVLKNFLAGSFDLHLSGHIAHGNDCADALLCDREDCRRLRIQHAVIQPDTLYIAQCVNTGGQRRAKPVGDKGGQLLQIGVGAQHPR